MSKQRIPLSSNDIISENLGKSHGHIVRYIVAKGIATRSKDATEAPGLTTKNKKLLGAPGIATKGAKR